MASTGFKMDLSPKLSTSFNSILEILNHLQRVTQGSSFFLNSVQIMPEDIRQCCENYWYGDSVDHLGDGIIDMIRVKSLIRFTDLVFESKKQPVTQRALFDIRERLRSILPSSGVSGMNQLHMEVCESFFETPFLDQKVLTLSLIDALINLCEALQSVFKDTEIVLHEAILSNIQVKFVQPYCRILWARAKQELQE